MTDGRAYRDARGRWVSEGRRALGAASRGTQAELARRLRVSQPTISQICAGAIRPGLDLAVRVEALLGIRVSAWTIAPNISPLLGVRGRRAHPETRTMKTRTPSRTA